MNEILTKLLSNQNLCKYIYYPVSSPLTQPTITDTKKLLFTYISPIPILPSVTDTAKSFIIVTLDDFNLGKSFKVSKVVFDIVCHVDLWKIDGGKLRPFRIMHEIDTLYNEQRIFGIGKLNFDGGRRIIINDKFQGYQLRYRVYEFN